MMNNFIEAAARRLSIWQQRQAVAIKDRDGDKEWLGMCDMMVVSYRMVLTDLQTEAQVRAELAVS